MQALARYRALGDAWGLVLTLNSLGWLAWSHGDYAQGKRFAQEAQQWNQGLGNWQQEIESQLVLANLELWLGDLEEAEAHLNQVRDAAQRPESASLLAAGLPQLTILATLRGNYLAAAESAARTAAIARDRGHRSAEAGSNVTWSLQLIHLGEYRQAQRLLAEALHHFQSTAGQPHHMIGLSYLALGMAALGLADADAAVAHLNAALADQRATDRPSDIAGSLAYLGRAQLARDETEEAAASLHEAVRLAVATHSIIPLLEALVGLAGLAYRVGDRAEAEHLLKLAALFPLLTGSQLHRSMIDIIAARLGVTLQIAAGPASPQETRRLWSTADRLLARFFADAP
jgi:tetratricopeptide (TPR) repeat protein